MKYTEIGALIGCAKGGKAPVLWFQPLRLTNTGGDAATVSFNDVKNAGTKLSIRKKNDKPFKSWDLSAIALQPDEYIEIIGDNSTLTTFMGKFQMTGSSIAASGNLMSILYGEGMTEEQSLIIPGNQLSFYQGQPYGLFIGCQSLVTAPELPATTLTEYCYYYMFNGCSNLQSAPELPATNLATACYSFMFNSCSNLQSAPELPAEILANDCYKSMFGSCSALSSSPQLPAENLVDGCYSHMFHDCINLSSVTAKFVSWDGEGNATQDWLFDVASEGTFTCPAGLDTTTRDNSHVPENWTVVNA